MFATNNRCIYSGCLFGEKTSRTESSTVAREVFGYERSPTISGLQYTRDILDVCNSFLELTKDMFGTELRCGIAHGSFTGMFF